MTADTVTGGHCDECGRDMPKAHRIHAARRFCSNCYGRLFKPRHCPRCSRVSRLPKFDFTALCKKCEVDKPCIRCGKLNFALGKIVAYGPVCNSCSVYFRPRKLRAPSIASGEDAENLTALTPAEGSNKKFGTCVSCRRHRKVFQTNNRRNFCMRCVQEGSIPCPRCGEKMPAGRGNSCEPCYWRDAFLKRLAIDEAGFARPRFVSLFREFGMWLLARGPAKNAALRIHHFFFFFFEMERLFGEVPTYPQLVKRFSAEDLRGARIPMLWLSETAQLLANEEAKEDASEWRRIEATLSSVPSNSMAAKVLNGYYELLRGCLSAGKTTLRSVRLALRPAASLILLCLKNGNQLPDQNTLDRYLIKSPGQKAAVTGFVSFFNQTFGASLLIRANENCTRVMRTKELESQMIALITLENRCEKFLRKWLSVALTYFHGLALNAGRQVNIDMVSIDSAGWISVVWQEKTYLIPHWEKSYYSST